MWKLVHVYSQAMACHYIIASGFALRTYPPMPPMFGPNGFAI
jgi:hypothetical protein